MRAHQRMAAARPRSDAEGRLAPRHALGKGLGGDAVVDLHAHTAILSGRAMTVRLGPGWLAGGFVVLSERFGNLMPFACYAPAGCQARCVGVCVSALGRSA